MTRRRVFITLLGGAAAWPLVARARRMHVWLAASLWLVVADVAVAQVKIDLSKVTCKQFLGLPRDHSLLVLGWLQGYYLEDDAEPIVDVDKITADLQGLTQHCTRRPDQELIDATDELFENAEPPALPQRHNGSNR